MQGWKNSWFLAQFDIRKHGLGYALSILFFAYAAGMTVYLAVSFLIIYLKIFTRDLRL